jgi:hypothetical protein
LQSVALEHTSNASVRDFESTLAELLGDDLAGGIRIEKPVPDDLANDFIGSSIVVLRTTLLAEQSRGALFEVLMQYLEVPLLGVAVLGGSFGGTQLGTLPLVQHGQLPRDFVVLMDWKRSLGTKQNPVFEIKLEHGSILPS